MRLGRQSKGSKSNCLLKPADPQHTAFSLDKLGLPATIRIQPVRRKTRISRKAPASSLSFVRSSHNVNIQLLGPRKYMITTGLYTRIFTDRRQVRHGAGPHRFQMNEVSLWDDPTFQGSKRRLHTFLVFLLTWGREVVSPNNFQLLKWHFCRRRKFIDRLSSGRFNDMDGMASKSLEGSTENACLVAQGRPGQALFGLLFASLLLAVGVGQLISGCAF